MTGIYKIENLVNNKVYIGQAINIENRWKGHKKDLRNNYHCNKHLQSAWDKYGEENFKFEIIEECEEDNLTEREQYWIDFYGGLNSSNNYNKRDASSKGGLSEESKLKVSNANKGKVLGPLKEETKQKISKALKGRPAHNKGIPITEETRKKISEANKGKPKYRTPEQIEKHQQAMLGHIPWNKGLTKNTSEIIAKYSNKLKNNIGHSHIVSNKAKEKIRQANIGRIVITNGSIKKRIYPEQFEFYKEQGFYKFTYKNDISK
jgi:group I intron endonuclease